MVAFNSATSAANNIELLPAGLLAWAHFRFKEFRFGRETGGRYAAIELTISDPGPGSKFEGKKIFTNIMDPDDQNNSEAGRKMGEGALARLLEAAGIFDPANPATYEQFGPSPALDTLMQALDDKIVAIKVKVAKGTGGYSDKNEVGEWLSPNPISGGNKGWVKLMNGDNGLPKLPAGAITGGAPRLTAPAGFAQPAGANVGQTAPAAQRPVVPPQAGKPVGAMPSASWLTQAQQARPQG